MKLDRTLAKEIRALFGNGSREAKFAALKRIDAARKDLSTTRVRDTFADCLREHGRAVVAVCVAATLDARKERLDYWVGPGHMRSYPCYPETSRPAICNVLTLMMAYTQPQFVLTPVSLSG